MQRSFRPRPSCPRAAGAGTELERLSDHGDGHKFRLFVRHPHQPVLLAWDETALPAVEGILRSRHNTVSGQAVVGAPSAGGIRLMGAPPGVEPTWVVRRRFTRATGCPGEAAVQHRRSRTTVPGSTTVLVAGESGLPPGLRRHLAAGGHDEALIRFTGYWESGRAALTARVMCGIGPRSDEPSRHRSIAASAARAEEFRAPTGGYVKHSIMGRSPAWMI